MSSPFWLSSAQSARVESCFPAPHAWPRGDDSQGFSGMIFVSRKGMRWRDSPAGYGPAPRQNIPRQGAPVQQTALKTA